MMKRGFLLILLCTYGFGLFAENAPEKNYPGSSVVAQEIENHQVMLKSLQRLVVHLSASNQPEKTSIENLVNYAKTALISLEYLDSVWESKGRKLPENDKHGHVSASMPCSCNGEGICAACGGDGYVWTTVEKGKEKRCRKCKGSGKNGGFSCGSCTGSGWANAHPNSPARNK